MALDAFCSIAAASILLDNNSSSTVSLHQKIKEFLQPLKIYIIDVKVSWVTHLGSPRSQSATPSAS